MEEEDEAKPTASPMMRICQILGVPKEKREEFESALGDLIEEHVSSEDADEDMS